MSASHLTRFRKIPLTFVIPPIAVIGTIGNICALIVLNQKCFSSRPYRYLFWLAIADLCTLITGLIYQLTDIESYNRQFGYAAAFFACHIVLPFINVFGATSAFMIVALTADRLLAVCRPFAFYTHRGMLPAGVAAMIAFGLSLGLYSPNPFQHTVMTIALKGGDTSPVCYRCTWSFFHRQKSVERYVFIRQILTHLVPVAIVFVLNLSFIVVFARRRTRRLSVSYSTDAKVSERRRLIRMILLMTTVFIVCLTPMALSVVALSTVKKNTTSAGFELFRSSSRVLSYVNHSSNFYLYLFCSPMIRASFADICRGAYRKMLAKFRPKQAPIMSPPNSPTSTPTDIVFVTDTSEPICDNKDHNSEGD